MWQLHTAQVSSELQRVLTLRKEPDDGRNCTLRTWMFGLCFDGPIGRHSRKDLDMIALFILSLLVFCYLVYVLLKPERF